MVGVEDEGEEIAAMVRRPHLRALDAALECRLRHRLQAQAQDCVREELFLEAVLCRGGKFGNQERRRPERTQPLEEVERLSSAVLELKHELQGVPRVDDQQLESELLFQLLD